MRAAPRLLGRLQGHAESLMLDTCTITRQADGALNETTGQYTPTTTTVYDGKCRLQFRSTSPLEQGAPGAMNTAVIAEVHLPLTATGVLVGDTVTVTDSLDPDAVGRTSRVRTVPTKTLATARQLLCEDSGI